MEHGKRQAACSRMRSKCIRMSVGTTTSASASMSASTSTRMSASESVSVSVRMCREHEPKHEYKRIIGTGMSIRITSTSIGGDTYKGLERLEAHLAPHLKW